MKKCSKCGLENIDEAIFCANCGARLNSSTDESNSTNNNSNLNSPNSSSNKSEPNQKESPNQKEGPDKWKICCCYVSVILLIISIIFGSLIAAFPENFPTYQEGDFEYLDFNNDDKLSFEEARQYDLIWKIEKSDHIF